MGILKDGKGTPSLCLRTSSQVSSGITNTQQVRRNLEIESIYINRQHLEVSITPTALSKGDSSLFIRPEPKR